MKLIKRIIYLVVVVIVALFGAALAVKNSHNVNIYYYLGQINSPLSVIVVVVFSTGVLLTLIAGVFLVVKLRLKVNNCQRRYRNLEKKYTALLTAADQQTEAQKLVATLPPN